MSRRTRAAEVSPMTSPSASKRPSAARFLKATTAQREQRQEAHARKQQSRGLGDSADDCLGVVDDFEWRAASGQTQSEERHLAVLGQGVFAGIEAEEVVRRGRQIGLER